MADDSCVNSYIDWNHYSVRLPFSGYRGKNDQVEAEKNPGIDSGRHCKAEVFEEKNIEFDNKCRVENCLSWNIL